MARILVTCVGSGVGQSVIDSLNMLREDYIIGGDMNRNVYATHFCDEFCFLPSFSSEKYLDYLLDLAKEKKVDLIIPGHDQELLILSKAVDRFHKENIEVLVSEPVIIEISRDKYLWYKYFKEKGCNIVPTFKVGEFKALPDSSIFPAIIKPAGGSASQGISIVHDISEISQMSDNDIIQPYLFPTKDDPNYNSILKAVNNRKFVQMSEISIQLIFGKDAKFKAIFISKNILKNGVPVFVDPIQPEDFEYLDEIMKFVPICEANGVKGPVNIQGRITEHGILFFEMNMRFTGITGNRAQLGFNEVKYLINNFLGINDHLKGYSNNKLGVRQVACTTIPREDDKSSPKNYTILGAGGFIGSNFVENLIKSGNHGKINIICRETSYEKYQTLFSSDKFTLYKSEDTLVQTVYAQTDILVNFVGALAYQSDIEKYDSVLFQYQQILKMINANIPLIINISSQSVYDQTLNKRKTENDDVKINNAYAFQKYMGEQMFKSVKDYYPLSKCISLRIPRVVGRCSIKENGFFMKILQSLKDNNEIYIDYPNNNVCLLDLEDAISVINFVIENDFDFPDVVNVAGVNITLNEYAETAQRKVHPEKNNLIRYGDTEKIVNSSQIDDSLLRSFGWENKCQLNEIIEHIYEEVLRCEI